MAQETTALKCEDIALLAILDVLEADLGTTRGRKELGVNYRTFAKCRDTREVTPLMRRKLKKYVGWGPVVDSPVIVKPLAGEEEAYGSTEDPYETLSLRVEDLEAENRELRQANETQTAHIADWGLRLASLGERRRKVGLGGLLSRKRHTKEEEFITDKFMAPPEPGVVTLEHRLGEEKVFGRAAPSVTKWREVQRTESTSSEPVEQAEARVRRLRLEKVLIKEFRLALPPCTEPLDDDALDKETHRLSSDFVYAYSDLAKARRGQL